jgi:hypothetical protein
MTGSARLDGVWRLERTSGLLPPLALLRKEIRGSEGWTAVGPLKLRFRVVADELRYRSPLVGLVDVLSPAGADTFAGTATILGRPLGTFRMKRETEARR